MPQSPLTARLFDDADTAPLDPFALFEEWFDEAARAEVNDPNAMTLATVDAQGLPDARMVLLNGRDPEGFVFFTNMGSAKGEELAANPRAALLFHWKSLRRQVRIRGPVERVGDAVADAYFASRPRRSQLGAHASRQSRPLPRRADLEAAVADLDAALEGKPVLRPAHWSGYRIRPVEMEFWQDGAFRLHDRVRFTRPDPAAPWARQRLYP